MASLDTTVKFCMENSLNVVGVRPFSVYGPWGRPDEDIYKMAVSLADNSPVEVYKTRYDLLQLANIICITHIIVCMNM